MPVKLCGQMFGAASSDMAVLSRAAKRRHRARCVAVRCAQWHKWNLMEQLQQSSFVSAASHAVPLPVLDMSMAEIHSVVAVEDPTGSNEESSAEFAVLSRDKLLVFRVAGSDEVLWPCTAMASNVRRATLPNMGRRIGISGPASRTWAFCKWTHTIWFSRPRGLAKADMHTSWVHAVCVSHTGSCDRGCWSVDEGCHKCCWPVRRRRVLDGRLVRLEALTVAGFLVPSSDIIQITTMLLSRNVW